MKAKLTVTEDTLTPYFEELYRLVSDEDNAQNFLRDSAAELHFEHIEPLMPDWNPNLKISPMEHEHQIYRQEGERHIFDMIYTGFTQEEKMGLEKVFAEFAMDFDPATKRLSRDYAYFQETGEDEVVDPKRYTPQHTHFVKRGTASYTTQFHYKAMAYANQLLHLERWQRTSHYQSLEDWWLNR